MSNIFYQAAINTKLQQLDFPQCITQAEKHHKVLRDPNELFNKVNPEGTTEGPDMPIFFAISERPEVYIAFYKNLYLTYSYDKEVRDRVFRIYMKRPEDKWEIPSKPNGKGIDAYTPTNIKAEVYINYNVNVLDVDRCMGDHYRSGSWDKTFYKTLKSFLKDVEGYTETRQIEIAYEN